jgi:hypothetical protein
MRPNLQKLSRNLFVALALSQLPRFLVDALAADSIQWQAHDAAMHLSVCALVALVAWMIPYQSIAAKCAALAWLGFELVPMVESVLRLLDISPIVHMIAIQCVAALALPVWYLRRTGAAPGDVLDDTHLFICRIKPRTPQDVILSMLGRSPLGGVAIYYRRQFWHYKRGVLVKEFAVRRLDRYVPTRSGVPPIDIIKRLDEMVGSRWSVFKNCITMLYATAKYGAPIFNHRR